MNLIRNLSRSLTQGTQASTSKIRKIIPTFGALDPKLMFLNIMISEKLKKITTELDAKVKRRPMLGLREGTCSRDHIWN